jgi:hypothetical protein
VKSNLPTNDPSAKDAAVVVRSDCTSIVNEIACNPTAAEKSTFVGYHLSGPVYIRVEGAFYSAGFELSITKLPLSGTSNADCKDWPDGSCNQYRDTNGIGVLRSGKATVEPFWGTTGTTQTHVARLALGSDLVARPSAWSGSSYTDYADLLSILAGATATETKTATMDSPTAI